MDGFGAALAEWIAWRMLVAAGIIGTVCIGSGLAIGWLMFAAAPPKPQTWDEWLATHKQTCPTCQKAFDEADGAMCVEAFDKFKEFLKAEKP